MEHIYSEVKKLLNEFSQSKRRSPKRNHVLEKLHNILETRIHTITYNEINRELCLTIVDNIVCDTCGQIDFLSSESNRLMNFLFENINLFLKLAQNESNRHNSRLWRIIICLGT